MSYRRNAHYEADGDAFPSPYYTVADYRGVAVWVRGWQTEPDEDTEWSGYEVRTGRAVYTMVGDDRLLTCEPDDLTPLAEDGFCRGCGQTGCGHNVMEVDA